MRRLEGKMMLITGAAVPANIGRATALAAARHGAAVAINDLPSSSELGHELAEEITDGGGTAFFVPGDITDVATTRRIVDQVVETAGRLDVLVNNAGGGRKFDLLDITEDDFDEQLSLNLKAPFFMAQAAARHMLKRGEGHIINIASDLSYLGHPTRVPYSAAKGGIRSMTKSLALALAPTVQVNAVAPGPTDTPRIWNTYETTESYRESLPLKRLNTAEEVANTITWLASSEASAFTGQTLNPNGGVVMV